MAAMNKFMRILHVTEYCHAGSIGGTERYILDLVKGLESKGIANSIAWLKPDGPYSDSEAEGIVICTLPSAHMRVDSPPTEFNQAAETLLESQKPDCLHFHTFGLSESAFAKIAKKRRIPYAFTYHSPAWTCRRETLLLYGDNPCDGEVRPWRCSACQSHERLGASKFAGQCATVASAAVGWAALGLGATSSRRRTAFFYDTLRYKRELKEFLAECDLVVSCCDWSEPVLKLNGAREKSILHCPQGVSETVAKALTEVTINPSASDARQFVVGFVGRTVEIKGAHILMEGFSRFKAKDAGLRIVGWDPEHAELPYAQMLQRLAAADARIELVPKKPFRDTLAEYKKLSLLAIPSIWMETGPLTLMEALAIGVPVYGSNRLGQLNLLREHGRIVESNTPDGWQTALTDAYGIWKAGKWNLIKSNAPVRTMGDVAEEMCSKYSSLARNETSLHA